MKRALRFVECRQLSPQQRVSIKQLYEAHDAPMLVSPNPMHNIHVALHHDTPLAAIVANFEGYESSQVIRLSKPGYRDRHVFRGLINRILHQWSRDSVRPFIVSLQQVQHHNQDELRIFQALGFIPYHETRIYTLPLIPFEKETYRNWRLELMDYGSRGRWLLMRNQCSHLFADPFPMTDQQFHESIRRQRMFYQLAWCNHPIGIIKAHIEQGRLIIHELQIDGDDALLREAISFLQQKFYAVFQHTDEMHIAMTTLQPDLLYAARQQGATQRHTGYFLMTTTLDPAPLY